MLSLFGGSARFSRLLKFAETGALSPPMDLRFLKRPRSQVADGARARVSSFLAGMYESVAEVLPDVKDQINESDKMLALSSHPEPLAAAEAPVVPDPAHPVRPGKKIRRRKRSLELHPERTSEFSGFEERWLPPGVMRDYFEQMKVLEGNGSVSFTTFWRATFQQSQLLS